MCSGPSTLTSVSSEFRKVARHPGLNVPKGYKMYESVFVCEGACACLLVYVCVSGFFCSSSTVSVVSLPELGRK